MFLKASNNNRASIVLHSFLETVRVYGLPQYVRSDHGGENVDVAWFMFEHPVRAVQSTIECYDLLIQICSTGVSCTLQYFISAMLYFMYFCFVQMFVVSDLQKDWLLLHKCSHLP